MLDVRLNLSNPEPLTGRWCIRYATKFRQTFFNEKLVSGARRISKKFFRSHNQSLDNLEITNKNISTEREREREREITVEVLTLHNWQKSGGFKNVSISLVCVIFMTQKLRQSYKEVRKQWLLAVLLICSRYNLVTCPQSKQKRTGKNSRSTFP